MDSFVSQRGEEAGRWVGGLEEFGALLAPKAAANLGALQNASKEIGKFVFVFSGKEDARCT